MKTFSAFFGNKKTAATPSSTAVSKAFYYLKYFTPAPKIG